MSTSGWRSPLKNVLDINQKVCICITWQDLNNETLLIHIYSFLVAPVINLKKTHCIKGSSADKKTSLSLMVNRERKEDGKPRVTSVAITTFEKKNSAKTFCVRDQKTVMLSKNSDKWNRQVIAPSRLWQTNVLTPFFYLLSTGPGTIKLFPASVATLITSLRSLLLNNNEVGFENDYKDSHLHILKGKCFTSA